MNEQQITEQIRIWETQRSEQRFEVAAKFAGEARSHLHVGKVELARRKLLAAFNVATGGLQEVEL